jgi:hypothetical protein
MYGQWRCSSTIVGLNTIWAWVVSFTLRPLYPPRNGSPHYSVYRKETRWTPEAVWMLWRRKKSLPFARHWTLISSPSRVTWKYSTPPPHGLDNIVKSKSTSKLYYDRRSAGQSVLEQSTHLGLTIRSWLLSDSCGFVGLGRPVWREDGSAICNCYWPSPA